MTEPTLFIGLMSGTSLDAIDAVVVDFTDDRPRLLAAVAHPLDADLRSRLLTALAQFGIQPAQGVEVGAVGGERFAAAAIAVREAAGLTADAIAAIGSHGQTLRHRPDLQPAFSLQIGDPARIAERTGITTVADFRRRDVAAGGQGAPLVPAFHAALFRAPDEDRAVLNIGGMANLTLLPGDPAAPVTGFDTGPGNVLLDGWIRKCRGEAFDRDGAWAAGGRVDETLLARLLEDPWFRRPPPKSTGREHFDLEWVKQRLPAGIAPADVQATLAELTARSIADAIQQWGSGCHRLLVCGGGARNGDLLRRLQHRLPETAVEPTDAHGLPAEWVEAVAFAWLARETLVGRPGNLPGVTGAAGPRTLGAIYPR